MMSLGDLSSSHYDEAPVNRLSSKDRDFRDGWPPFSESRVVTDVLRRREIIPTNGHAGRFGTPRKLSVEI